MKNKIFISLTLLFFAGSFFSGCAGAGRALKVVDYTDKRVTDLILTKRVVGRRDWLFFSTTKMSLFLEGNIQGTITDYYGNPIEGVTVKAVADMGSKDVNLEGDNLNPAEENAASFVNLTFTPGLSDSQGLYKVKFSLPVVDKEVDVKGRLIYNPGWEQQKLNLGKTYEPQLKQSTFRIYYNMDTGFLAFGEGVRPVVVQPVGEGQGRMKTLPGSPAPGPAKQDKTAPAENQKQQENQPQPAAGEDDIFKAFNF